LQGFTFITKIFKDHQKSLPSRERRNRSGYFKTPFWDIIKPIDTFLKNNLTSEKKLPFKAETPPKTEPETPLR